MQSTRGKLLVATPNLSDPNFRRTVVFMLEHGGEGALGVVLNRPSNFAAQRVTAHWHERVAKPEVVFVGGPVSQSSIIGVSSMVSDEPRSGWRQVNDHVGIVDLSLTPEDVSGIAELRIFAGYAAWESGQLEGELAENSWFVLRLAPSDPFSATPDELWWQVFARQEDPGIRRLRLYPRDPSHN